MPDPGRCIDLIQQADGSWEEKFECAQAGYWGNVPIVPALRETYLGVPPAEPAVSPEVFYSFTVEVPKMRRCGSGCNCGGGGTAVSGAGAGGAMGLAGASGGPVSFLGAGSGSTLGFNVQFSGFLLFLLLVVVIWRKER